MIKLKSMLNIMEQFPQATGAPVPLQIPPDPTTDQSAQEQPAAPEPEMDSTPTPEDPGEYDWTKDFRAFEDAKNRAESEAKKKLLDKMNKQLVGKSVSTNASRGYGQPKTDHTIDKIKKISVEFWYKEWVVIVQDENDKKYFLTPGVNIKIEQGTETGSTETEAPGEPEAAATAAPGEEQPNVAQTGQSVPPAVPQAAPITSLPTPPEQVTAQQQQPPAAPIPQDMGVPQMEIPPVKKKKRAIAEEINNDLKFILSNFMVNETKNFGKYIKKVTSTVNESKIRSYQCNLEIPIDHIRESVDTRDIQLAAREALWESGNIGQKFSNGSINISKIGRLYLMEYTKETGWKS